MPEEVRALNTLASPNYDYACEISTSSDSRSAEQWARAVFEGAPPALRRFILTGWVVGLGLRLAPRPSPAHILGWKILTSTPTSVVLGVESWALSANLVVQVQGSRVIHATFVRYKRRPARILWAAAAPIHHRVIPYLLAHAAAHPPQLTAP